jgi:hypothetical protein
MRGNDGRARVQIPDERPSAAHPVRAPSARAGYPALVHALEAHVATLMLPSRRISRAIRCWLERINRLNGSR